MIRLVALALCALQLASCVSSEEELRTRHGSPLHTYTCSDGKTFLSRQIMSGEVEVTAGGRTRDVTNADGDPIPGGPRLEPLGGAMRLSGMPGGPYEACRLDIDDRG